MTDGLEQLGGGLQLLPGALQVLALPESQAQSVSDLGLVLRLVDLLGDMKPLLEIADRLADVPVLELNPTCITIMRVYLPGFRPQPSA